MRGSAVLYLLEWVTGLVNCPGIHLFVLLFHSVEVDSLGPLLGQIVVALSPLIPDHPQAVADIFRFLIIKNK